MDIHKSNDFVVAWTADTKSLPIMLTVYLAALEERVGPAGQNQIREALGIARLPVIEVVEQTLPQCPHENTRDFRDGDGGHRKCLDCGALLEKQISEKRFSEKDSLGGWPAAPVYGFRVPGETDL